MTTIPPSAKPNIAPSEERVKELREFFREESQWRVQGLRKKQRDGYFDDLLAVLDDYSVLKAEAKRLNTWHSTLSEAWKARAEKSEARVKELEAELAKQAPLIDAVMASIKRVLDFKPFWQKFDHSGFMNSTQLSDRDLFMKLMADCRAALALREEKK